MVGAAAWAAPPMGYPQEWDPCRGKSSIIPTARCYLLEFPAAVPLLLVHAAQQDPVTDEGALQGRRGGQGWHGWLGGTPPAPILTSPTEVSAVARVMMVGIRLNFPA